MVESISSSAHRAAHLVERLGRLLRAGDHAGGLNPAQWEALRYLARANRFSRSPAMLADYLGATRGTVSQTLIALEAKGLVAKEPDARDRRAVRLALTEVGWARLRDDAVTPLAAAIDATGEADRLADLLAAGLRAALARRGGRAFGVCRTCRHFRADLRPGDPPHHCALLDEALSEGDSALICCEQEVG